MKFDEIMTIIFALIITMLIGIFGGVSCSISFGTRIKYSDIEPACETLKMNHETDRP